MNSLIEALQDYDPADKQRVAELCEQFSQIAGVTLLDDNARKKVWGAVATSDPDLVVPLIMRAYIRTRRNYASKIGADDGQDLQDLLSGPSFELGVGLMMLLGDAGEFTGRYLEDVEAMLLDEDQEIHHTACCMLVGSSCQNFVSTPTILQLFSSRGVWEYPFNLGEAVIKACKFREDLAAELIATVNGDANINVAIATIVARLPVNDSTKHSVACRIAESSESRPKCAAIAAIADVGSVSPEATQMLEAALDSDDWCVRAHAAEAVGRLKLKPNELVPKLEGLLHDTEGNDFSVQDCVLKGLGNYGDLAKSSLPKLEQLRQDLQAQGWEAEDLEEVEDAISKVRD